MIGRLRGKIVDEGADGTVVLDVSGVGYEVRLPTGTRGRLRSAETAENGQQLVDLVIHTHVRDDAITLFGFASTEDRIAFRALLGVSSIGPRLALAILGALDAQSLAAAIRREDKTAFKGISGVGKKTVERLLIDLKDKLMFADAPKSGVHLRAVPGSMSDQHSTVVSALVQLGYKRSEAEHAVESAGEHGNEEDVEVLLRAALTALG